MQAMLILQIIKDFFSNRWVQIALGAIIVILLVKWAVDKLTANPKDVKLPQGGEGIPKNWDPTPIAQEAHDVFDGLWTSPADKGVVIGKLLALTDDQLTAVYNKFGDMFGKEKNGSLYEWIQDEYLVEGPRDILLDKMRKLNLI